jgi:hypothetical protein
MSMHKGRIIASIVCIVSAVLGTSISGCTAKTEETTTTTAHTTWMETTTSEAESVTETETETTADSAMLREPFVGRWIGIVKVGKNDVFYTLVFNSDGTGSQSCEGKTQNFRFDDPDMVKKTIAVTSDSGEKYTVSFYNGENASNKTFTFSSGLIVDCQVPSVDCLRIRATDPALTGTWTAGKGKKVKKMVFSSDNIMTDKNGKVPYTIERKIDGTQVIRLLNGDIRYKIEDNTLTLDTNNTDIEKEWKKK